MSATSDTTPFCGNCGAQRPSVSIRFCQQCGTSFSSAPAGAPFAAARAGDAVTPALPADILEEPRPRRPWMVAMLAFLSGGTYSFFWLWRSWLELKRIVRRPSMHPFWHAVATLVPLYGLFRFHEHFRLLDDLLRKARVGDRAGAALLTLIYVLLTAFSYVSLAFVVLASGEVLAAPAGGEVVVRGLGPLSILVVGAANAYVASVGQVALNAYYRSLSEAEVPQRTHAFEWIFLVLFAGTFVYQLASAIGITPPTS